MKKKKRKAVKQTVSHFRAVQTATEIFSEKSPKDPKRCENFVFPTPLYPPVRYWLYIYIYIYFIDLQLESTQKHEDSSLKKNQLNLNNIQTYEHPPHFHPSGAGRPCRSISQLHSVRLPNEQACVTAWTTPADVTA